MRISVTMQFHDEIEFLPGFFSHAVTYADEIHCACHAASDGSLEYAQEFAKNASIPITIECFPKDTIHQHGFCHMKNVTLKKCTGDWVVSLDADEEMHISKDALERFGHRTFCGIATRTMHLHDWQVQPNWSLADRETIRKEAPWIQQKHWRVIRNGRGIHWRGLIHEELRLPGGRHLSYCSPDSDITMYHFGAFAGKRERDEKEGLYAELLLRIVENPKLRDGTNRYWWQTYYEQNKDTLLEQRAKYRSSRGEN